MTYEEAVEIRQTRHWGMIQTECDRRIEGLKNQLTTCPPDKLTELQIKLRTWAEFKKLPDDVVDREHR